MKFTVIEHFFPFFLISYLDIIKTIRDPEEPGSLEELKMVDEDLVTVKSIIFQYSLITNIHREPSKWSANHLDNMDAY